MLVKFSSCHSFVCLKEQSVPVTEELNGFECIRVSLFYFEWNLFWSTTHRPAEQISAVCLVLIHAECHQNNLSKKTCRASLSHLVAGGYRAQRYPWQENVYTAHLGNSSVAPVYVFVLQHFSLPEPSPTAGQLWIFAVNPHLTNYSMQRSLSQRPMLVQLQRLNQTQVSKESVLFEWFPKFLQLLPSFLSPRCKFDDNIHCKEDPIGFQVFQNINNNELSHPLSICCTIAILAVMSLFKSMPRNSAYRIISVYAGSAPCFGFWWTLKLKFSNNYAHQLASLVYFLN